MVIHQVCRAKSAPPRMTCVSRGFWTLSLSSNSANLGMMKLKRNSTKPADDGNDDGRVKGGLADVGHHVLDPLQVLAQVVEGLGQFAAHLAGAHDADEVGGEDAGIAGQGLMELEAGFEVALHAAESTFWKAGSLQSWQATSSALASGMPTRVWKVIRVQKSISSRRRRLLFKRSQRTPILGGAVPSRLQLFQHGLRQPQAQPFEPQFQVRTRPGRASSPSGCAPACQWPGNDRRA